MLALAAKVAQMGTRLLPLVTRLGKPSLQVAKNASPIADDVAATAIKASRSSGSRYTERLAKSAGTGIRHQFYAGTKGLADKAPKGVSHALHATAETVRFSPVIITGAGLAAVGTHLYTDGESTKAAARISDNGAKVLASAVHNISPEAAKAIESAAPNTLRTAATLAGAPLSMAIDFTGEIAEINGLELSDKQQKMIAYTLSGNLIGSALTAANIDISAENMANIMAEAIEQDDPDTYIRETLDDRFGVTQEQFQTAMDQYKGKAASPDFANLQLSSIGADARETAETAAQSASDLTGQFNILSRILTAVENGISYIFNTIADGIKNFFGMESAPKPQPDDPSLDM